MSESELSTTFDTSTDASLTTITQRLRSEMTRLRQVLEHDLSVMATITVQVQDYLGQPFTTDVANVAQQDETAASPLAIRGTSAHITVWSLPQLRPAQPMGTLARQWAFRNREALWIVALLLLAALAHGINMMHFPYYEDDEGTYMSQAWAVLKLGRLASYTYWYDHAPAGWIQIAGWALFTGGFHTFGSIIASGRVLMLVLQVASSLLVYRIARSMSQGVVAPTIAVLAFALSPFGLHYHRRILLDNIATFWMLLSIVSLVRGRLTLTRVWFSGAAQAISILSKELTIFLVPAMAYLVFWRSHRVHRWFALVGWLAVVGSIFSLYFLMATLKGELFPTGSWLGGTAPHVSLVETLKWQTSRGKDGGLADLSSRFWWMVKEWAEDDPLVVIVGSACAILSVLAIYWNRLLGVMGLVSLSLWFFLGRGGEIIVFYLIPLLPLLAINLGLVTEIGATKFQRLVGRIPGLGGVRKWAIQPVAVGLCLMGTVAGYRSDRLGLGGDPFQFWSGTQAVAQQEAVEWIKANIKPSSNMIIDQYMWPDLHDIPNSTAVYQHADYYWKVEQDPEIREGVFRNDWHTVDYIVTTPQLLSDMQRENMILVADVLAHSTPIAHFDTGGWVVEVRQVQKGGEYGPQSSSTPGN
jgi:hypothetical protein